MSQASFSITFSANDEPVSCEHCNEKMDVNNIVLDEEDDLSHNRTIIVHWTSKKIIAFECSEMTKGSKISKVKVSRSDVDPDWFWAVLTFLPSDSKLLTEQLVCQDDKNMVVKFELIYPSK